MVTSPALTASKFTSFGVQESQLTIRLRGLAQIIWIDLSPSTPRTISPCMSLSGTVFNRKLTKVEPLLIAPLLRLESVDVYSGPTAFATTLLLGEGKHPITAVPIAMEAVNTKVVLFPGERI
jgi:hypothetical protein